MKIVSKRHIERKKVIVRHVEMSISKTKIEPLGYFLGYTGSYKMDKPSIYVPYIPAIYDPSSITEEFMFPNYAMYDLKLSLSDACKMVESHMLGFDEIVWKPEVKLAKHCGDK